MSSDLTTPGVVILNDTRHDHHHGCTRVMEAIEGLVARIGARVIATARTHTDWTRNVTLLKALSAAKLVLVNGEGTIHHNQPAGRKLLEVAAYAGKLGIPSVLVNCGWQANGPDFLDLLRQFTYVCVRDTLSAREIRTAGITCHVVPDLSFYLPFEAGKAQRQGVGFTDSVLREISLELESLRRVCGGQPTPVQFAPAGALGTYRFFREYVGKHDLGRPVYLARMLKMRYEHLRNQRRTSQDYVNSLSRLELLVSGRFHSCTLAMVAGTPFVAVGSNSHKIEALIADATLASWRAARNLNPETIRNARATGWSTAERTALADYIYHARSGADTLFGEIRKLM